MRERLLRTHLAATRRRITKLDGLVGRLLKRNALTPASEACWVLTLRRLAARQDHLTWLLEEE